MLTNEEKKGLEIMDEDKVTTDIDKSMNGLAMQLTHVKGDLQKNRLVVANLFNEVE